MGNLEKSWNFAKYFEDDKKYIEKVRLSKLFMKFLITILIINDCEILEKIWKIFCMQAKILRKQTLKD